MTAPLLHVTGLKVNYGHVEAVKGIDLELHEGQITSLVGANGAGKSTTLLALSGLVKKAAGRVMFDQFQCSHFCYSEFSGRGKAKPNDHLCTNGR